MTRLLDNGSKGQVAKELRDSVTDGAHLSILTRAFSICAYLELASQTRENRKNLGSFCVMITSPPTWTMAYVSEFPDLPETRQIGVFGTHFNRHMQRAHARSGFQRRQRYERSTHRSCKTSSTSRMQASPCQLLSPAAQRSLLPVLVLLRQKATR